MAHLILAGLLASLGLAACADVGRSPTVPHAAALAAPDAVRAAREGAADRVTAAARWNLLTREIIGRRGGSPNDAARAFALVSVAQYDAVIAAEDAKARGHHPSESGASAGASAAVLAALYGAEASFVAAQLAVDAREVPTLPSERHADFAAGVAVGRSVAAAVLARAATDGSAAVWTGTVPQGPDAGARRRRPRFRRPRAGARCVRGS